VGSLVVVTGPMFAGKTTDLLARVADARAAERVVQVVRPANDTRSDHVVTHDGARLLAETLPVNALLSRHVRPATELLVVDEAQFFQHPDFALDLNRVSRRLDVVAGGLNRDYLRRPFGAMPELARLADETRYLFAECAVCRGIARFTYRTSCSDVLVLPGGAEAYEARCETCYDAGGAAGA